MSDNRVMKLTLDRSILEKLRNRAVSAAHLVGHLDDADHADLLEQLGDHVDTVVHGLTEILDAPRALAEHDDAAAPDDGAPHDGVPMPMSSAGGASSRHDDLEVDDTLHALRGGAL